MLTPIVAVTKDGIENTFREITVITRVNKNKLPAMTKKFGSNFKDALVFDRIKEELRFEQIMYTFFVTVTQYKLSRCFHITGQKG